MNFMEREEPPHDKPQSATSNALDQLRRQQQALRRLLQDPAGPAYHDPIRAAELAGFLPRTRLSIADRRSTMFCKIGVRQAISHAVLLKSAAIDTLRHRIIDGMTATKFVTVRDAEGVRSVEVPDHTVRCEWAKLCASVENLLPGKGSDGSDTLARHLEHAEELEELVADDLTYKLSKLSRAARYELAEFAIKVEHRRDSTARGIAKQILGKSIQEFEQHVQEQADREVSEAMQEVFHRGDDADGNGGENSHE